MHLGGGYMNQEILIEEEALDDFLRIITPLYNEFVDKNSIYKIYEILSSFFKPFREINKLLKSQKKCSTSLCLKRINAPFDLDKDMQYSCAYFHNKNISFDQAQLDKKEIIIEKLQIKENMKVLDIVYCWGGMALQIAKDTGANIKVIILSKNQLMTVKLRAQTEGLNEKVSFEL